VDEIVKKLILHVKQLCNKIQILTRFFQALEIDCILAKALSWQY